MEACLSYTDFTSGSPSLSCSYRAITLVLPPFDKYVNYFWVNVPHCVCHAVEVLWFDWLVCLIVIDFHWLQGLDDGYKRGCNTLSQSLPGQVTTKHLRETPKRPIYHCICYTFPKVCITTTVTPQRGINN